jgi:hypothetical protein
MEKIKISSIIEVAGRPEAHIKETIDKMLEILKKNSKITIIKKEIAPTKKVDLPNPSNPEQKVEIFSSFIDSEIEFPNLDEVMQFIHNFMPSSIEIIEPETLKIEQKDMENNLNDLLSRLHQQARIIMEYQALQKEIARVNASRGNQ